MPIYKIADLSNFIVGKYLVAEAFRGFSDIPWKYPLRADAENIAPISNRNIKSALLATVCPKILQPVFVEIPYPSLAFYIAKNLMRPSYLKFDHCPMALTRCPLVF